MNSTPFITVLITACDRREFIKGAIDSALSQSLDKEEYEIIVIKNYEDKSIDKYIRDNDIKYIYSNEESLAGKLIEGIQSSRGKIICFLEDDDLFTEGKLLHVSSLFKKYGDLTYYHNDFMPIDKSGNKTALLNKSVWFNMSCISVRRDILELDKLRKIGYSELLLYCEALSFKGKIIKDKFIGTFYRFHSSSSNSIEPSFEKSKLIWEERKKSHLGELKALKDFFNDRRIFNLLDSLETGKMIESYLRGYPGKPKHIMNYLVPRRSNIIYKSRLKKISFYFLSRIFRNRILRIYDKRKNQDYNESKNRLKGE